MRTKKGAQPFQVRFSLGKTSFRVAVPVSRKSITSNDKSAITSQNQEGGLVSAASKRRPPQTAGPKSLLELLQDKTNDDHHHGHE